MVGYGVVLLVVAILAGIVVGIVLVLIYNNYKKGRKKSVYRRMLVVGIVASIVLASSVGCLAYLYLSVKPPPHPYNVLPQISYGVTSDGSNYTVEFTQVKEGKGYSLDIDILKVEVISDSQSLVYKSFSEILNNTQLNITFYDSDSNGRLSEGDELVTRGNLAVGDEEIRLVTEGSCIKKIYFK